MKNNLEVYGVSVSVRYHLLWSSLVHMIKRCSNNFQPSVKEIDRQFERPLNLASEATDLFCMHTNIYGLVGIT